VHIVDYHQLFRGVFFGHSHIENRPTPEYQRHISALKHPRSIPPCAKTRKLGSATGHKESASPLRQFGTKSTGLAWKLSLKSGVYTTSEPYRCAKALSRTDLRSRLYYGKTLSNMASTDSTVPFLSSEATTTSSAGPQTPASSLENRPLELASIPPYKPAEDATKEVKQELDRAKMPPPPIPRPHAA